MGGAVSDFQSRIDPPKVGIRRQQSIKRVDPVFVGIPMRLDEHFKHRNRGGHARVPGCRKPGEHLLGQIYVFGIFFNLKNEDRRVQTDNAVLAKKFEKLLAA